ncbi:MAG: acylphosphatase [Candidatus Omnitrophica bacterium]|nr:acylphosphatase [Candidatus Omnitrophota bacterium]
MPQKRAHIIFSGTVQGVGFRWAAERAANSIGLTGWVKNCPDGTVAVVCEGEEKDIHAFMAKIKKDMEHYMHSTDINWENAKNEFDSFGVKFY